MKYLLNIRRNPMLLLGLMLVLAMSVAACDSSDPAEEDGGAPIARAGNDQTVQVGVAVELDGSASSDPDGDDLTFAWTVVTEPDGSSVTLNQADTSDPTFTPAVAGAYVIRLTVSDGSESDTDEVTITAQQSSQTIQIGANIDEDRILGDIFENSSTPDYLVTTGVQLTATLTIEPGVVIAFEENTGLTIDEGGTIRAIGTATERIVLTGEQESDGYWSGLLIRSGSANNVLEYVDVLYGGSDYGNLLLGWQSSDQARVAIRHSSFQNSGTYGIYVEDESRFTAFENNVMSDNSDAPLYAPIKAIDALDASSTFNANNGPSDNRNYVEVYGQTLDREMTWPALTDTPYLIHGSVTVAENLVVAPGADFMFAENSALTIDNGASFNATGTADQRITFRGEHESPGLWAGINIRTNSTNNVLAYVDILHGGSDYGNLMLGWSSSDNARVHVTNSSFRESASYGIWVEDQSRLLSFANNEITGSGDAAVYAPVNAIAALDGTTVITGNDRDAVHAYGQEVADETTWNALQNASYLFEGTTSLVDAVTVEPGAHFQFMDNASLWVNEGGSLNAVGTSAQPIVFEGAVQSPGYWGGIYVRSNTQANTFDYVTVADGGSDYGNVIVGWQSSDRAVLNVSNSTLRNSATYGAYVMSDNGTYNATNVTYLDNTEGDVRMP